MDADGAGTVMEDKGAGGGAYEGILSEYLEGTIGRAEVL